MNDTLKTTREQLAAMRRIGTEAVANALRPAWEKPYVKRSVFIRSGVLLDPERSVRSSWKPTPYDKTRSFREEDGKLDLGDGFGVVIDAGGPFKLRCIKGKRIGEVIEVDSVKYWLAKAEDCAGRVLRWEPVSDGEKLRGPMLPEGFPSDVTKARRIAGMILKRDADQLSFAEILECWKQRRTNFEVAK
jgi:hypothetical protein